jgi:hypothetical protein
MAAVEITNLMLAFPLTRRDRLRSDTFCDAEAMSALPPPKADMCGATTDVRYGPIADLDSSPDACQLRPSPIRAIMRRVRLIFADKRLRVIPQFYISIVLPMRCLLAADLHLFPSAIRLDQGSCTLFRCGGAALPRFSTSGANQ